MSGSARPGLRPVAVAVAIAGLLAVTPVGAPVAAARPDCTDVGSQIRCETNGSVSIKAVPQTRAHGSTMPGGIGGMRRGMLWGW